MPCAQFDYATGAVVVWYLFCRALKSSCPSQNIVAPRHKQSLRAMLLVLVTRLKKQFRKLLVGLFGANVLKTDAELEFFKRTGKEWMGIGFYDRDGHRYSPFCFQIGLQKGKMKKSKHPNGCLRPFINLTGCWRRSD